MEDLQGDPGQSERGLKRMSVRIRIDKPGSCRSCPLLRRQQSYDCPLLRGSEEIESLEEQYKLCPMEEDGNVRSVDD